MSEKPKVQREDGELSDDDDLIVVSCSGLSDKNHDRKSITTYSSRSNADHRAGSNSKIETAASKNSDSLQTASEKDISANSHRNAAPVKKRKRRRTKKKSIQVEFQNFHPRDKSFDSNFKTSRHNDLLPVGSQSSSSVKKRVVNHRYEESVTHARKKASKQARLPKSNFKSNVGKDGACRARHGHNFYKTADAKARYTVIKPSLSSSNFRVQKSVMKRNSHNLDPAVRAPSPQGDINDPEYIDLLLEYEEDRKRLQHLEKAESKKPEESYEVIEIDDDDDDVLELRLAALTSVKQATERADDAHTVESPPRITGQQLSRGIQNDIPPHKRCKENRNDIQTTYEKEESVLQRRRETLRILAMSDPNEQYESFLKFIQVNEELQRAPMSFLDEVLSMSNNKDNYDEVEMELDSGNEGDNSFTSQHTQDSDRDHVARIHTNAPSTLLPSMEKEHTQAEFSNAVHQASLPVYTHPVPQACNHPIPPPPIPALVHPIQPLPPYTQQPALASHLHLHQTKASTPHRPHTSDRLQNHEHTIMSQSQNSCCSYTASSQMTPAIPSLVPQVIASQESIQIIPSSVPQTIASRESLLAIPGLTPEVIASQESMPVIPSHEPQNIASQENLPAIPGLHLVNNPAAEQLITPPLFPSSKPYDHPIDKNDNTVSDLLSVILSSSRQSILSAPPPPPPPPPPVPHLTEPSCSSPSASTKSPVVEANSGDEEEDFLREQLLQSLISKQRKRKTSAASKPRQPDTGLPSRHSVTAGATIHTGTDSNSMLAVSTTVMPTTTLRHHSSSPQQSLVSTHHHHNTNLAMVTPATHADIDMAPAPTSTDILLVDSAKSDDLVTSSTLVSADSSVPSHINPPRLPSPSLPLHFAAQQQQPNHIVRAAPNKRVVIYLGADSSSSEDEASSPCEDHNRPATRELSTDKDKNRHVTPLDRFLRRAKIKSQKQQEKEKREASLQLANKTEKQQLQHKLNRIKQQQMQARKIALEKMPQAQTAAATATAIATGTNTEILKINKQLNIINKSIYNEQSMIDKTKAYITGLRKQVARHKNVLRTANDKVFRLKKELEKTQKLASSEALHVTYINKQMQKHQATLDDRVVKCQQLEKEKTAANGRRDDILLNKYGKTTLRSATTKRKMVTQVTPEMKSKLIGLEKRRLQDLMKEKAEKLKQLRDLHVRRKHHEKLHEIKQRSQKIPKTIRKIITQDLMEIQSGSDNEEVVSLIKKRRRLSLGKADGLNDSLPTFVRMCSNESVNAPKSQATTTKSSTPTTNSTMIRTATVVGKSLTNTPSRKANIAIGENHVTKNANIKQTSAPLRPQEEKTKSKESNKLQLAMQYKKQMSPQNNPISVTTCNTMSELELFVDPNKMDAFSVKHFYEPLTDEWTASIPKSQTSYTSPLLHFKAYRFNPFYRTKEKKSLTSLTVVHKIDPSWPICPFDLTGTCNDNSCRSQHLGDINLNEKELLIDLLSYNPTLAGAKDNMTYKQCHTVMENYASKLLQPNLPMTIQEQCLLLVSKINDSLKQDPPNMTITQHRRFRSPINKNKSIGSFVISQDERNVHNDVNCSTASCVVDPHVHIGPHWAAQRDCVSSDKSSHIGELHKDDILLGGDIRYYMLSNGQDIQDMEAAVVENPNNTQLLIKLAYKKLHDDTNSDSTFMDQLEEALSVLARGLESNRNVTELWYHYLILYEKCHDRTQLHELYQQAIQYAPSYNIYYQYLCLQQTYEQHNTVCKEVLAWLRSQYKSPMLPELHDKHRLSHYVLEIVLYKCTMAINMSNVKAAQNTLKSVLYTMSSGITESPVSRLLSATDLCVVWICYIHLLHTHTLPNAVLYDPSNTNPSTIVCKDMTRLCWPATGSLNTSRINNLFNTAKKALQQKLGEDNSSNKCSTLVAETVQKTTEEELKRNVKKNTVRNASSPERAEYDEAQQSTSSTATAYSTSTTSSSTDTANSPTTTSSSTINSSSTTPTSSTATSTNANSTTPISSSSITSTSASSTCGNSYADIHPMVMLHMTMAHVDAVYKRYKEVYERCCTCLSLDPHYLPVYKLMIRVLPNMTTAALHDDQVQHNGISEILHGAVNRQPQFAQLTLLAAQYELSKGNHQTAKTYVHCFVSSLYQLDSGHNHAPQDLYCRLLDLPVPLRSTRPPPLQHTIDTTYITTHKTYIHLLYCLLLELEDSLPGCSELYESLLSVTGTTEQLQAVWNAYIQYAIRRYIGSDGAQVENQNVVKLMRRCLSTVPCKVPRLYRTDTYWLDYTYHNTVIDVVMSATSNAIDRRHLLVKLADFMPHNVPLMLKLCEFYREEQDWSALHGTATMAISNHPRCLPLRKIYLCAVNKSVRSNLVREAYQKSIQHLPLVAYVWKNVITELYFKLKNL